RLYGDHIHRHFFNDGIMTPGRAADLWEKRALEIERAVIGESARWGDFRRPGRPFTRDGEWTTERQRLLNEYFPSRAGFLVREFRKRGLYPAVIAPTYSQHGGIVEVDAVITLSAGTIFQPQPGVFLITRDGSDPRLDGGAVSPSAEEVLDSLVLNETTVLKARTYHNGDWSALTEARFVVGAEPARSGNLVLSELLVRPADVTEEEKALGFSRSDFEYLELENRGEKSVDLFEAGLVRWAGEGVRFSFAHGDVTTILPGEVVLVVRNKDAFEKRFGTGWPIAGEWMGGNLGNGGETLRLVADGQVIDVVSYDDQAPWPAGPFETGLSLVREPDGGGWTGSQSIGGTPGRSPNVLNPLVRDEDGDGLPAFLEEALLGNDLDAADVPSGLSVAIVEGEIAIEWTRAVNPGEVDIEIEYSGNGENWLPFSERYQRTSERIEGGRLIQLFKRREGIPVFEEELVRLRAGLRASADGNGG
ncbi:MAG: lamin tail domain-containing protein, partial [Verrucomicrobiota bacterium]